MDSQQTQCRRHLRPSVEGLESLRLLAGMAPDVAVHPVALVHAEATKAPAAVAVVNLHGTIHATAKVSISNLVIAGSGNLGAVGTASINLRVSQTGSESTFTLLTKKGQITLAATGSTLPGGGNSASFTSPRSSEQSFGYTVVGGTGAYAHSTGSGTILEAIALGKGDKITVNFEFS